MVYDPDYMKIAEKDHSKIPPEFRFRGVRTFVTTIVLNPDNVKYGDPVLIDDGTMLNAHNCHIRIGNFTHIAFGAMLTGGDIDIDDFVGICPGAKLIAGSDDFVSWGFGNPTVPDRFRNTNRTPITIGRFCMVGTNATVLPGVTMGEGSCVAANQLLNRNLEDWEVYLGRTKSITRNRIEVLENYGSFLREYGQYFPQLKP